MTAWRIPGPWLPGAAAALTALLARPELATACAGCISSAFGDRTFNWAYLGLLLAPFAVMAFIGGVLARYHYRSRDKETT